MQISKEKNPYLNTMETLEILLSFSADATNNLLGSVADFTS